jgi:hypothetical protein
MMLCIQFLPTENVDGAKEADRGGIVKARGKIAFTLRKCFAERGIRPLANVSEKW